jgi:uncharacterized protein (TIGR00730 family)
MSPARRQRYALKSPELNAAVEALVADAAHPDSLPQDMEITRQLIVSALRLLRSNTPRSDLKLTNSAVKELRHAFRVFAPYTELRKVAVFGSARTPTDHADWQQAYQFAERIAREGWMAITGAGGGIMGAAQGGAGREASFGVNIRLPFEQDTNQTIAGDHKLINFRYFFTRKVIFVKEAHAIVLFPGGFGTHDEGFEALTLIQTGKSEIVPVVFVDEPGGHYWRDWENYVRSHLFERGLIAPDDLGLFLVTDSVDLAIDEILGFYRNYHSSRYVRDKLVLRVREAPDAKLLEALNDEFSGILRSGAIETARSAVPGEDDEAAALPRVTLDFDRRQVGRLRALIDRLNAATVTPAPARDAATREIIATPMSAEEELEQEREENEGDDRTDSAAKDRT